MTTFLFWNLNKKSVAPIIANLATRHNIDILMLVECEIPVSLMLEALNPSGRAQYYFAPGIGCEKVAIYTKFSSKLLKPVFEEDYLTIRTLSLPGFTEILLAVLHFPSKLRWTDEDQATECTLLSTSIRKAEQQETTTEQFWWAT